MFLLIEMLRSLPENVCLLMIGTGPEEQNLKNVVASYRLEHRVHMIGHVPYTQLPEYMNCMDIGLVPSMECYGILAKSPEDIMITIEVIAGKDENDFSMPDETQPNFSMPDESQKTTGAAGRFRRSDSGIFTNCARLVPDTQKYHPGSPSNLDLGRDRLWNDAGDRIRPLGPVRRVPDIPNNRGSDHSS